MYLASRCRRPSCTWQAGVEDPHVVGDVVHLTVVDDGGQVLVVTRGLVVTRDFERQPIALTRLFDVLSTVGDRVWRATAVRAAVSPLTVHGAHHVDGAVVAARQGDVIVEAAVRAELVCRGNMIPAVEECSQSVVKNMSFEC